MRKSFREIMTRQPIFLELYEPIRTRLREHKMYVICGLILRTPTNEGKGGAMTQRSKIA